MSKQHYDAAVKRAEAELATALAGADTYLNHSVGIGEHPQSIDEETDKFLERAAAADDRLEILKKHFDANGKLQVDPVDKL